MAYSEFFAMMPGDNTATVARGAAINFPQNGISDGIITRSSANEFLLPAVGIYVIDWQVSISEAAQIMIAITWCRDNKYCSWESHWHLSNHRSYNDKYHINK